jgi:hypothetical protein
MIAYNSSETSGAAMCVPAYTEKMACPLVTHVPLN